MDEKENFSVLHDHLINIQNFNKESQFNKLHNRLSICFMAYFITIVIIFFKIIEAMTNSTWSYQYQDNIFSHPSARATIRDRNGNIIATNITTFDLHLNCCNCFESLDSYIKLACKLNTTLNKNHIAKLKSHCGSIVLKRHLTPKQKHAILTMGLSGTEFVKNYKRFYPYGKMTSHLLGYVNYRNRGCAGIEMGMDKFLKTYVQKDLTTTMDVKIQCAVYDILKQGMRKYKYVAASVVILDCESAEILSLVSFPAFDSNRSKVPQSKEMFNHISQGLYEVGSVSKIFNTALALESRKINIHTKFDVSRPLFINKNFQITDLHSYANCLSVADIFRHSSNIGSARMALMVGKAQQKNFLREIGLLDQFFVKGLPDLPHPSYPANWNKAQAVAVSFGYAHTASALQLVAAFNGIINNGKYMDLAVIKDANDKRHKRIKQIISPQVSSQIRALMHYTVHFWQWS